MVATFLRLSGAIPWQVRMKFVPTLDFTFVPQIGDTEVHPLNGDTLEVLNNTYNTTLGISAECGEFTFGVAAKYGFGTDDRSNAPRTPSNPKRA